MSSTTVYVDRSLAGVLVAIWGILTDTGPQMAQRFCEYWQGYFLDQNHAAGVELRTEDIVATCVGRSKAK